MSQYGVDNPMKCDEIKQKARETCLEKYGVQNPMQCEEVKAKSRATMIERYGVEYPLQNSDIMNNVRATNIKKYGVKNPMQNEDIKAKTRKTNLERYGAENLFQSEYAKEKSKNTWLEKYGCKHPMQNDDIKEKMNKSKLENHSFGTSKPEEILYKMLVDKFGKNDVMRQYFSKEYPFACDFYIKSLNAYVELNANWTHNNHFFDKNNQSDLDKINEWHKISDKHPFYAKAIYTWSKNDVKKYKAAIMNNLNYVVFWNNDLSDVIEWFKKDCPLHYGVK